MLTNAAASHTEPEPCGWPIDLSGTGLRWRGRLWIAGAHALGGESLEPAIGEGAWVLDCAGLVKHRWEHRAIRFAQRVFEDLERVPSGFERLLDLCRAWAADLAREQPPHVVVACAHGMNRSALAAGLILREAGVPPAEAVVRIRAARPGALNNRVFESLIVSSG